MLKKHSKLLTKCLMVIPLIFLLDFLGIFAHLFEKSFEHNFYYPVNRADNNNDNKDNINAAFNLRYIILPKERTSIRLTLLIKSAVGHAARRKIIRKTWGYERRFSDVHIRRVFLLGINEDAYSMARLAEEAEQYDDIVLSNFKDSYFNNTMKTMSGLRWSAEHFNSSDYYMYIDDDYYVSIKNVLRFIGSGHAQRSGAPMLYAGYVFQTSPLRHKFSKWYISLKEYPFDKWPPYVTAGAFILSHDAVVRMYNISRSLPLFRFDDIYMGILALKAGIRVQHCEQFYFDRPRYRGPDSYSKVIASHGFDDPNEMENIWNECRSANYA